jgi:hypothetical protein
MTPDLGEPFWKNIPGLGDWVRIVDVVKRGSLPRATTAFRRFLEARGHETRQVAGYVWWCRRDALKEWPEFCRGIHLGRITGRNNRQDTEARLAELDRDEFAGMDLCDIFDALLAETEGGRER